MTKVIAVALGFNEYRSPGMPFRKTLKEVNVNGTGWRDSKDPSHEKAISLLLGNGYRMVCRVNGKGIVRRSREWYGLRDVFGETGSWTPEQVWLKVAEVQCPANGKVKA